MKCKDRKNKHTRMLKPRGHGELSWLCMALCMEPSLPEHTHPEDQAHNTPQWKSSSAASHGGLEACPHHEVYLSHDSHRLHFYYPTSSSQSGSQLTSFTTLKDIYICHRCCLFPRSHHPASSVHQKQSKSYLLGTFSPSSPTHSSYIIKQPCRPIIPRTETW